MTDHDELIWLPPRTVVSQVTILAERLDYAHELMNVPYMWRDTEGVGAKTCVIDTGVPEHVDLAVVDGDSVIPGYREDLNGHATHCGGIISAIAHNDLGVAGVAPDNDDYYIAALGRDGGGSITGIATAIMRAVDNFGVDVISMSLGVPDGYAIFSNLEAACDYAVSQGVTVVCAAGNENSGVGQPAIYDSVIAVAAIDSDQDRAWFSNQGPELDFAAPGVDVYSTYLNNRYAKLSGTSMACPMIAGVAALIIAKHRAEGTELSPAEVREHIGKIAFDIGGDGLDHSYGNGMPVFGKDPGSALPPPVPPPVPPPSDDGKIKSNGLPQANCVYWKMFGEFVDELSQGLDDQRSFDTSLAAALRKVRKHKTAVNTLINGRG